MRKMINISEQKNKVVSLIDELYQNEEVRTIEESHIVKLIENWYLSPTLKEYVGDTGIISKRVKIESPMSGLSEHSDILDAAGTIGYDISRLALRYVEFLEDIRFNGRLNIDFVRLNKILELLRGAEVLATNKVVLDFGKDEEGLIRIMKNGKRTFNGVYRQLEKALAPLNSIENFEALRQERKRAFESIESKISELEQKVSVRMKPTEGTFYLSALPEDMATASFNEFNWSSCFNPTHGCNALSPYHYIQSGMVMIAYFTPDNAPTFEYNGFEFSNKLWRRWVFIGDGAVAMPVSYPSRTPELENLLEEFLIEKGELKKDEDKVISLDLSSETYVDTPRTILYDPLEIDIKTIRRSVNIDIPVVSVISGEDIYSEYDFLGLTTLEEAGYVICVSCENILDTYDSYKIEENYGIDYLCEHCHIENNRVIDSISGLSIDLQDATLYFDQHSRVGCTKEVLSDKYKYILEVDFLDYDLEIEVYMDEINEEKIEEVLDEVRELKDIWGYGSYDLVIVNRANTDRRECVLKKSYREEE